MAKANENSSQAYVMTAPAPIIHVAIVKPHVYVEPRTKKASDPRFGCTFVFPSDHPDLPSIKKLMAQVAKAAFPGLDLKLVRFPLRSGDRANEKRLKGGKPAFDSQAGKVMLPARSSRQPLVGGFLNGKPVDLADEAAIAANASKLLYPGVEALGQFNFAAFGDPDNENGISASVTCYLNQLFSTGKGERLGGGAPAAETFSGYMGKLSGVDPLGTGSTYDQDGDEIPY